MALFLGTSWEKLPCGCPTASRPLGDWQHLWTGPTPDSSLCSPQSPPYGRKLVNICSPKEQIFGGKARGSSKLWRLRTQYHSVTEQQDRDGSVPGHAREVKNVLFLRSTEAKLYKVKWSQPPPVYSKWSMGCLSRAKSGRHFKQISHAASGPNSPQGFSPEGRDSWLSCTWKIRSLIPRGYSKLLTRPVCFSSSLLKSMCW